MEVRLRSPLILATACITITVLKLVIIRITSITGQVSTSVSSRYRPHRFQSDSNIQHDQKEKEKKPSLPLRSGLGLPLI